MHPWKLTLKTDPLKMTHENWPTKNDPRKLTHEKWPTKIDPRNLTHENWDPPKFGPTKVDPRKLGPMKMQALQVKPTKTQTYKNSNPPDLANSRRSRQLYKYRTKISFTHQFIRQTYSLYLFSIRWIVYLHFEVV